MNPRQLNPRQLEAFRMLMNGCTVTEAGERLGISQPAVSKLIAAMERECGFALFLRKSGRLTPSPEARMLYAEVDRVFVGMDRITRVAADIRDLKRGQLTIAALPAMALRFLPAVITRFSRDRHALRITLQSRTSRNVAELVMDQQVDLGISAFPADHPGVRLENLYRTRAVCAMPVGHRLARRRIVRLADLRDEPFITLASDDVFRQSIDHMFGRLGIPRQIGIETHMGAVACAFVANGAGVAVVDPFSASQFRSDEIAVRPLEPLIPFDVWLLFPTSRELSQVTEAFVSALRNELASEPV